MSVGGVGGRGRDFDLDPVGDAQSEPQAEAPARAARTTGGGAVDAGGPQVPRMVGSAVMAYDGTHHANRNLPDRSYGGVLDGRKNADGSWTVRVASFPTTIMGPRPGDKPFDISTYLWKNGKVTELKGKDLGALAAENVEKALAKRDSKAATAEALEAAKGLVLGGLGFPRVNQSPDRNDVARFKATLSKLEKDGKLDDLKRAVDAEQKRRIAQFGGRRPMDWYGPLEVLSAAVHAHGTAKQKKVWSPPR